MSRIFSFVIAAMNSDPYRTLDYYSHTANFDASSAPRSFLQDILSLDNPTNYSDDPAAFYQTPEFLRTNSTCLANIASTSFG